MTMSECGYIRLHRSLLKWEWYSDPATRDVFIHCLLKANWKDGRFQGIEVKRGSFVTSRSKLAQETGLSERNVRTALKHLISTGEVTKSSYAKYSIITIQNYEKYQSDDQVSDHQVTGKRPASDHNRKKKESNKEKSNSSIVSKATYSVVDYLNQKLGTHYKPTTPKTVSLIERRLNEGFTVEDFKKVIDVKYEEWKDDEKMSKFLRPETLFSNKFEGYLNQFSQNDQIDRENDQDRAKLERWYDDIFGV